MRRGWGLGFFFGGGGDDLVQCNLRPCWCCTGRVVVDFFIELYMGHNDPPLLGYNDPGVHYAHVKQKVSPSNVAL